MIDRLRRLIWPNDSARRFLTLLLLTFTVQQLLIVLIFPPFSGHDEVAHFDYARIVAQERRLPVIPELDEWRTAFRAGETPPGDFIPPDLYAYCLFTLEWWPCEPDNPDLAANPPYQMNSERDGSLFPVAWQYAANHPPLYYVLAAPVQSLLDGHGLGLQNRILRLISIPFGLLLVAGTFALGRQVTPGRGFVPVAAAIFVAFQPQVAFSAAIFNNDVTVIAAGAWLLALLLYGMRRGFSKRVVIGLGLLFGVGLLLKGTAIVFAPIVALAMILSIGWGNPRAWLPKGAAVAAIGLGVASPWYVHLWRSYGSFDGLDRVERLQASWNYVDGAPGFFALLTDGAFISRFWREMWGGYGWRRIPFEDWLLWSIGIVCAVCVVGLVLEFVRNRGVGSTRVGEGLVPSRGRPQATVTFDDDRVSDGNAPNRTEVVALRATGAHKGLPYPGLMVLVATVVVAYLAVIQFGTTFELAQARYAFPAMPALAVLLAVGLRALAPVGYRRYALVLWVAAHLAMTVYVYSAWVVPYWHLGAPR
ncbi:MAG: glycosyltransferase family 39 protein [Thermomicrobiales bacterium]|nr:glycosyltransferase family 39 protein [Thermomicrobiales bacterium]